MPRSLWLWQEKQDTKSVFQYSLVPSVILNFWAASPSLIQAINSSLVRSSFIQIAIFYCHNDILQILNISETGGDLIWRKKLSKARIVARHSSPDKWHLKSNDFFHFCGQEYIWFIFHFNNAQNQAARKWRVKKWPPFSESGLGTWYILWSPADSLSLTRLLSIAGLVWVQPPIDLHLIFEKLSLRNQVGWTWFFA